MRTTKPEKFLAELKALLRKYDARLELSDYESERCYSMWVFFKEDRPLDIGSSQPKEDERN